MIVDCIWVQDGRLKTALLLAQACINEERIVTKSPTFFFWGYGTVESA
jgi:hypothetical protein